MRLNVITETNQTNETGNALLSEYRYSKHITCELNIDWYHNVSVICLFHRRQKIQTLAYLVNSCVTITTGKLENREFTNMQRHRKDGDA